MHRPDNKNFYAKSYYQKRWVSLLKLMSRLFFASGSYHVFCDWVINQAFFNFLVSNDTEWVLEGIFTDLNMLVKKEMLTQLFLCHVISCYFTPEDKLFEGQTEFYKCHGKHNVSGKCTPYSVGTEALGPPVSSTLLSLLTSWAASHSSLFPYLPSFPPFFFPPNLVVVGAIILRFACKVIFKLNCGIS